MYVPVRTDQKCHKCVFADGLVCLIRENFGLPTRGPRSKTSVQICEGLLIQRGIPHHGVLSYNWQDAPEHSTLEG